MTPSDRKSVRNGTIGLNDQPRADFAHEDGELVRKRDVGTLDDVPLQHLITAAILATTAFRLRDQDGLVQALRMLVRAVRPFEAYPTTDNLD